MLTSLVGQVCKLPLWQLACAALCQLLSLHVNAIEQGVDFQCSSERSLIYGMNSNSSNLLLRMLVLRSLFAFLFRLGLLMQLY